MIEWLTAKNIRRIIAVIATLLGVSVTVYVTVEIDVKITPEDARNGWAGGDLIASDPVIGSMDDFAIAGAVADNSQKNIRLWDYAKQINKGQHFPTFRQQIGDCVSMGAANAVNYLSAVQIAKNGNHEEFHPAYQPYIYGTSRVQIGGGQLGSSDGSLGAWAAKAVAEYGVLAADHEGVEKYSGRVAKRWGKRGPPNELVEVGKQHLVKTVARVNSAHDVRDAICNGYPVTIASNWGGGMQSRLVDGRLVNSHQGTWNHQMCVIGYDGVTGSKPYYYILNSWGAAAHGNPPDGAPPGGFWVTEKDITYIVGQNDSWAFSNFEGFPAQELDWRIIGQLGANPPPPQQGDKEMSLALWMIAAVSFAIGIGLFLFDYPQLRKGRGWLMSIVLLIIVLLVLVTRSNAAELDFSLIGNQRMKYQESQLLFAQAKNMDFNILGPTSTNSNEVDRSHSESIEEPKKEKPTIIVYSMKNCPACKQLKKDVSKLPGFNFVIHFRGSPEVPSRIKRFPTLRWKDKNGKYWEYEGWPGPKAFKKMYDEKNKATPGLSA